jgi:O-antigen ligase
VKTTYTNLWLLIAVGGVFISSSSFMNVENDVKLYITSIATSVIVLLLSFTKKPLYYLKQSVTNKLFLYGLTFICFALSLQGFLQYVGVLSSNHYNFSITGSFENPAGFSAVLSLLFIAPAYLAFDFNHEHRCAVRLICAISSLLAFVMILLCGSRSGILAVLATLSIMICHKTEFVQTLKKHKWLNLLFSLIIIALLFVLYHLKADSANGRLLIWRVCMDMITERPLFGFGHGGFLANYMQYQAEYLSAHPDSPFIMLADNMNHPFNEYIKLTVEYGLIGLSLAVLLLYFIAKKTVRNGSATEIGLLGNDCVGQCIADYCGLDINNVNQTIASNYPQYINGDGISPDKLLDVVKLFKPDASSQSKFYPNDIFFGEKTIDGIIALTGHTVVIDKIKYYYSANKYHIWAHDPQNSNSNVESDIYKNEIPARIQNGGSIVIFQYIK